MGMFKKATKTKLKARIALDGPAGSGKTYTGLRWAFTLAGKDGRVAVIDTEHGSARKYQGEAPDGFPWEFEVCELQHFAPSTYTNVIREAGKEHYDVLLVDSLSHAWEGVGGALDIVDRKSQSGPGGKFGAWRDVTPMHREMIEAMLSYPADLIVTMRSKMAYEVETDEKGKIKPVKVGLKPIQREGMEYEFDVVADLDLEHMVVVAKSRCSALDGARAIKPDGMFITPLVDWLRRGEDPSPPIEQPQPEPKPGGVQLSGQEKQAYQIDGHEYFSGPHDPCGLEIAEQIKQVAASLNVPVAKLAEMVQGHGITKLTEMPLEAAEVLLAKLQSRALEEGAPF